MTTNVHHALRKNPEKAERILFEICQHYDKANENQDSSSSDSENESPHEGDKILFNISKTFWKPIMVKLF